ncbi:hypothetical protein GOV13_05075 [Candidatus Pacearchaeota archaeon]|nr:hypothetical protein [Candidatus Pacearchaeota archaeon]
MTPNTQKIILREWKNILFDIIIAALTIVIVIKFYENSILTTILVSIIAFIGLIKWKSKLTLILFIIGGLAFGIVEAIVTDYGVWRYNFPDVYGVPIWLFIIWGTTCAFIYQISVEIKRFGIKK